MKIIVKVKPWSKIESVKNLLGDSYAVSVKEPAEDGKANKRAIELLADYFEVNKSSVHIISGHSGRQKLVEVKK